MYWRCEMNWKRLLILILYAAISFGGSFSEITCKSGSGPDAKFHPDDDDNKSNNN
jgi:hypothetical protein